MDPVLIVAMPDRRLELTHDDLVSLVTDDAARWVGELGRGCTAVRFETLSRSVGTPENADHATFHAADGYAASIPLDQAVADGVLLVPGGDDKVGVRLIVDEGGTTCLNVKAVTRIELTRGPGKHTIDPNPHDNAHVPGWDG